MKKLFGLLIFLSIMGLFACNDENSTEAADDCLDDPSLCSTPDTETDTDTGTDF